MRLSRGFSLIQQAKPATTGSLWGTPPPKCLETLLNTAKPQPKHAVASLSRLELEMYASSRDCAHLQDMARKCSIAVTMVPTWRRCCRPPRLFNVRAKFKWRCAQAILVDIAPASSVAYQCHGARQRSEPGTPTTVSSWRWQVRYHIPKKWVMASFQHCRASHLRPAAIDRMLDKNNT
jgi:hypothetical protein